MSEIPVFYFDPEPEPLTASHKFEVGDRIDMGDYVFTLIAELPSDEGTQSFRIALADDTHTLNEHGTTDCPIERVRAYADPEDGVGLVCSACGAIVDPAEVSP